MKIAVVTGCPSGAAHSRMASEALRREAQILGYELFIEENGGWQSPQKLKPEQIAEADVVIIASAIIIPEIERFKDKKILEIPVNEALIHPKETLQRAVNLVEGSS
jgi:fructose-specific phosphotransferase system component IIB